MVCTDTSSDFRCGPPLSFDSVAAVTAITKPTAAAVRICAQHLLAIQSTIETVLTVEAVVAAFAALACAAACQPRVVALVPIWILQTLCAESWPVCCEHKKLVLRAMVHVGEWTERTDCDLLFRSGEDKQASVSLSRALSLSVCLKISLSLCFSRCWSAHLLVNELTFLPRQLKRVPLTKRAFSCSR